MKKICASFIFLLIHGWLMAQDAAETLPASGEESALGQSTGVFRQEGIASWYGQEFAGLKTASGEIFDPAKLTCAHAELPFGTYLIVTNTENGKKVAVRVNDRGPFVRSRIIDVSRAAAEYLDMLASGTAHVVIEATTAEAAQNLARDAGLASASTATQRAAQPAASAPAVATAPATAAAATTAAPTAAAPTATASPTRAASPAPSSSASATAQPAAATPTTAAPSSITMLPTAPRTPSQSTAAVPPLTAPPASNPTVSRVTGQVENLPEIRRAQDSAYVVQEPAIPIAAPPIYPVPGASTTTQQPSTNTQPSNVEQASNVPQASNNGQVFNTPQPSNSGQASNVAQTTNVQQPSNTPQSSINIQPSNVEQPPPSAQNVDVKTGDPESVPDTRQSASPQTAQKTDFTGSKIVSGKNYRVQVGSFTNIVNASELFLTLSDAGLNPSYERYDDKYYRVIIMNVSSDNADAISEKLASLGIQSALVREDAVK